MALSPLPTLAQTLQESIGLSECSLYPESSNMLMDSDTSYDSGYINTIKQELEFAPEQPSKTYTQLESFNSVFPPADADEGQLRLPNEEIVDLQSWTRIQPYEWTRTEVLDFVYYCGQYCNIDGSLSGEAFQNVTGEEMTRMTSDDFLKKDPRHGLELYRCFQDLINSCHFLPPYDLNDESFCPDYQDPQSYYQEGFGLNHFSTAKDAAVTVPVAGHDVNYDVDPSDKFQDINTDESGSSGYDSDGSSSAPNSLKGRCLVKNNSNVNVAVVPPNSHMQTTYNYTPYTHPMDLSCCDPAKKVKRRPGRPPKNKRLSSESSTDGECPMPEKRPRGRRPGQTLKGKHLWEFVRDLLKNDAYCPKYIKWEDRLDGVFRFVRSEAVARMWGEKKKNPGMTYEKLSRAMRFCRTAGYFDQVPKTGRFPKKLCFKFGPRASGWKEL